MTAIFQAYRRTLYPDMRQQTAKLLISTWFLYGLLAGEMALAGGSGQVIEADFSTHSYDRWLFRARTAMRGPAWGRWDLKGAGLRGIMPRGESQRAPLKFLCACRASGGLRDHDSVQDRETAPPEAPESEQSARARRAGQGRVRERLPPFEPGHRGVRLPGGPELQRALGPEGDDRAASDRTPWFSTDLSLQRGAGATRTDRQPRVRGRRPSRRSRSWPMPSTRPTPST